MKTLMSWFGLFVVFVLFVAFNILAGSTLTTGHFDLTANKLYTLSDGTKNVLAKLDSPINLHFYFSKKVAGDQPSAAGLVSYAQRVRELLDQYAANSGGKLKLDVSDPEPFSETEDRAVQYGLKGVPASASNEMLYFGLAGTSASSSEDQAIEFFNPEKEESLEYDITKLVYNLSNPKKKSIGVITSLPMDGDPTARMMNPRAKPQDPWVALEQLRQTFDVKVIPPTSEKLEDNLDVLVLVHPQNLSNGMLYSIDQFVLRGGKVIAFIDPYCASQTVREDPQNPLSAMTADRSSSLGVLGDAWGIEMAKDDIAADKDLALRTGSQGQPIDNIVFIGARKDKDALDKDDFTTSQLDHMYFAFAGILKKKDGATTTVTPLVETTKNSMRIPKTKVQFQTSPTELLEGFQSSGEKLMLAARISGPVKTAFPEGQPKNATEGADAPAPMAPADSLKESKGPINVIVVADADMLADDMWVRVQNFFGQKVAQAHADNGAFLVNVVDNLSGSNDMISLRSRGRSMRPFDKVDDLRKSAESKFRQKEKDLEAKLRDTQEKLEKLQGNNDSKSALILTPEQVTERDKFFAERDKTRTELRRVKHDLQTDIDALKVTLMWSNGISIPLVVLIIGGIVWILRRNKMKEARENALAN